MLQSITNIISYAVTKDGFSAPIDSESAAIGGAFFTVVLSLAGLFFLLLLILYLVRGKLKTDAFETDSMVSNKGEDPEDEIVSSAFRK
jgi:hypothetical protein